MKNLLGAALIGAAAGTAGALVQAAIGATQSLLFLPPREDANLAPRLVDRAARAVGLEAPLEVEWALGTLFHFAYGAGWGAMYGVARERTGASAVKAGLVLGGIIHAITFPRWGLAVVTNVERPPERRTKRMDFVAVTETYGFGLATAAAYELINATRDAPVTHRHDQARR